MWPFSLHSHVLQDVDNCTWLWAARLVLRRFRNLPHMDCNPRTWSITTFWNTIIICLSYIIRITAFPRYSLVTGIVLNVLLLLLLFHLIFLTTLWGRDLYTLIEIETYRDSLNYLIDRNQTTKKYQSNLWTPAWIGSKQLSLYCCLCRMAILVHMKILDYFIGSILR